ncbi:MAG: flagellar export chaperone FliS [Kineosporiaceae bacterium]
MSSVMAQARARYASDASQTASPARLLTMLYDRLVLDLTLAHDAMLRDEHAVVSERLSHASDIMLELHSTLDVEAWPEGRSLAALYLWMVQELLQARLRNQPQRVAACRDLVIPLRDAWHAASGVAGSTGSPQEHHAQGGAVQGGAA